MFERVDVSELDGLGTCSRATAANSHTLTDTPETDVPNDADDPEGVGPITIAQAREFLGPHWPNPSRKPRTDDPFPPSDQDLRNWRVKQPFPGVYLWRSPFGQHFLVDHTGTHHVGSSDPDQATEIHVLPADDAVEYAIS